MVCSFENERNEMNQLSQKEVFMGIIKVPTLIRNTTDDNWNDAILQKSRLGFYFAYLLDQHHARPT